MFNFRYSGGQGFKDKLERAAEVAGITRVDQHLGEMTDLLLDEFLSAKDPVIRQQRREERAAKKARAATVATVADAAPKVESPRTIRGPLRDRLLIRANHQCEYCSDEGVRCSARSGLQIDHIFPWALRGGNEEGNLRVLCAAHNRFFADRSFGPGFMNWKIECARIERGGR